MMMMMMKRGMMVEDQGFDEGGEGVLVTAMRWSGGDI